MAVLAEWADLIRSSFADPPAHLGPNHMANLFYMVLNHARSETRLDYTFATVPGLPLATVPAEIPIMLWEGLRDRRFQDPTLAADQQHYFRACAHVFRDTCGGRRLGLTSGGHIGLYLGATQTGDWVYLFSGARLPFSLRHVEGRLGEDDSRFELIGPAFVQGIMQGITGVDNMWSEIVRLR